MCHLPVSLVRFKLKHPQVYLGGFICSMTVFIAMLAMILLAPVVAVVLWGLMIAGLLITLAGFFDIFSVVRIHTINRLREPEVFHGEQEADKSTD